MTNKRRPEIWGPTTI